MQDLKDIAAQERRDIVRMVYEAQSGHPGGSLGCVEFFTALYFKVMERKPGFDIDGKGEDIFFLSNGHISPVWYTTLARAGYFPLAVLASRAQRQRICGARACCLSGLPPRSSERKTNWPRDVDN